MEPHEDHFLVCGVEIFTHTDETNVPDRDTGRSWVTNWSSHSWDYNLINLQYLQCARVVNEAKIVDRVGQGTREILEETIQQ